MDFGLCWAHLALLKAIWSRGPRDAISRPFVALRGFNFLYLGYLLIPSIQLFTHSMFKKYILIS